MAATGCFVQDVTKTFVGFAWLYYPTETHMIISIVLHQAASIYLHRQPMAREDKEAQEDELLALASIYSEDEFKRSETAPGGEICVCLDLPPNFSVAIKGDCASNEYMGSFESIVSFLPPIILNFELPPGYPSTDPPAFTLSCKWLSPSQLALLCQRLDDLWEEYAGGVVLFAWMQFLKEGTLEYLKINSPYEIQVCEFGSQCIKNNSGISDSCSATGPAEAVIWDKRVIQDVESVTTLIDCILDFDEAQQKKCFDSKSYMCNICFLEKLGSECTHFKDCQHVYCNACLKDYYTVQIQDGQVQALNCPEPKCSSVATPAQVTHIQCSLFLCPLQLFVLLLFTLQLLRRPLCILSQNSQIPLPSTSPMSPQLGSLLDCIKHPIKSSLTNTAPLKKHREPCPLLTSSNSEEGQLSNLDPEPLFDSE
eukprot:XP_017945854.1 PREDICTED: E3 ubiquitin-protein ligase RNF14-like [Xenopus tropicalis]